MSSHKSHNSQLHNLTISNVIGRASERAGVLIAASALGCSVIIVFLLVAGNQMLGIHTFAIVAAVHQQLTLGYGSHKQFVCNNVSGSRHTIFPELTVVIGTLMCSVRPATIFALGHLLKKTIFEIAVLFGDVLLKRLEVFAHTFI